MDGGPWWATVHGVAKSWTWLSGFTHSNGRYSSPSWVPSGLTSSHWRAAIVDDCEILFTSMAGNTPFLNGFTEHKTLFYITCWHYFIYFWTCVLVESWSNSNMGMWVYLLFSESLWPYEVQEGGPLPGPKMHSCLTLGNKSEEIHAMTKQGILLGRGSQEESSRVREPRRTALPALSSSLGFYDDGISFQVVFVQSFWWRVLPGGARIAQPR